MGGPEARLPVLLLRKSTARLGPPHPPPEFEMKGFHSDLGGIGGLCPPIASRVECKVGSRSEPDLCTEEGGTRVSAYKPVYQTRTGISIHSRLGGIGRSPDFALTRA